MKIVAIVFRLLKFVVVGLVFAGVGEYWFSVLIRGDFRNFTAAIVFYAFYLVGVYASSRLLFRTRARPVLRILAYYVLYGLAGLMIEWFLIGNAPWGNPQASQIGMFAYWTCLAMMPLIFTDDRMAQTNLRKSIAIYSGGYAAFLTAAGHIVPQGPPRLVLLIWGFILGYVAATAFYVRYAQLLMKGNVQFDESARAGVHDKLASTD
jgi:hypothetical protein